MTSKWAAYESRGPRVGAPENVEIRAALPADCPDVALIAYERDGVAVEDATKRYERDLANQDHLLLVARVSGELAAFGRAALWRAPDGSRADIAPTGWYLFGVIVRDRWRRHGIGLELTCRRLAWIGERADVAYYFANSRNRASIDLHEQLGFAELSREFTFPGASFEGGEGILFRADLAAAHLYTAGADIAQR